MLEDIFTERANLNTDIYTHMLTADQCCTGQTNDHTYTKG